MQHSIGDHPHMNYLDAFEQLTVADLEGYVERRQEENLHLEFKLLRDASITNANDKDNFARALSGFANSSGGLVVWGVDARKFDGIDCACELKPMMHLAKLLARLNELTGDAVEPYVAGVRHRAIEIDPDRGYALSLVPESDTGPHMGKLAGGHYFKRTGDGFYKMEHFDIADMFGRRRRSKLLLYYSVTSRGAAPELRLGLRNEGRASAKSLFFAFSTESTMRRSQYGLDGNSHEGLSWLGAPNSGHQWTYGGPPGFAIHPGMAHDIACINLGIPARAAPSEDVVVRFAFACEDQPLEQGKVVIALEELK